MRIRGDKLTERLSRPFEQGVMENGRITRRQGDQLWEIVVADGFRCTRCGAEQGGDIYENDPTCEAEYEFWGHVHHVVPFDDTDIYTNDKSNLICLCGQCHRDVHRQLLQYPLGIDFVLPPRCFSTLGVLRRAQALLSLADAFRIAGQETVLQLAASRRTKAIGSLTPTQGR